MNIENLDVQEMNEQEVKQVEGGGLLLTLAGICFLAGVLSKVL
jgi:hypothetical protein